MPYPVSARSSASSETFRAAFCRRFRCPEPEFEKAVLRRCFPVMSRALGVVALALNPGAFRRELELIRRLGGARDTTPVRGELEGYAYENQRDKSARTQTFGLRLSRRRFLRVWRDTFGGEEPGGKAPSSVALAPETVYRPTAEPPPSASPPS